MPSDNRERSFENALAAHLRNDVNASPHPECADAETLAAYHEGSLTMQQTASLKSHVTACERCQLILTTLEATDEVPAPSPMLTQTAAAKSPVHILPARKTTLWQWIAPAGALAAVLLVWVAVHENTLSVIPKKKPTLEATHQVNQAQSTSSVPSSPRAIPSPSADSISSAEFSAPNSRSPVLPNVLPAKPQSKISLPAEGPRAVLKQKDSLDSKKADLPADLDQFADSSLNRPDALNHDELLARNPNATNQIVAVAPVTPELKEKLSRSRREVEAAAAPKSAPERGTVGTVAPSAPPPAPVHAEASTQAAALSGGVAQQQEMDGMSRYRQSEVRLANSIADFTISAPDGQVSWRIGQAGIIQFSPDAGKSWVVQPSGVIADLLAGSAPSDKICWIVGRAGTILRTTDAGAHWQKLRAPSQEDFRTIFAPDARQATVSTANGKFQTADGGITWKKMPAE